MDVETGMIVASSINDAVAMNSAKPVSISVTSNV